MYLNIKGEPTQTSSTKAFPWDYLCYYLQLIRMFSLHVVSTTRRVEEDFTRRVHGRPNRYEQCTQLNVLMTKEHFEYNDYD